MKNEKVMEDEQCRLVAGMYGYISVPWSSLLIYRVIMRICLLLLCMNQFSPWRMENQTKVESDITKDQVILQLLCLTGSIESNENQYKRW